MENHLEQELRNFKKNHYLNTDFGFWLKRVISLYKKFERLKVEEKQNVLLLELYTTYIQTLEILFINIFALSRRTDSFPEALFISSERLRKFISDHFLTTTQLSSWFLDKCIFQVQKNVDEKDYSLHRNLLMECAKDYLEEYDLLNAYKHGSRIHAKYGKTQLSLGIKGGQQFLLDESDSTLVYFTKEWEKKRPTIWEKSIRFKNGRIFGKALFVASLLNNMSITVLFSMGVKIRRRTSVFNVDQEEWSKTFGGLKVRKPLFRLKR